MKLLIVALVLLAACSPTPPPVECVPPAELFDCHPEFGDAGTEIVCADADGVTEWRFRGSDTQIHETIVGHEVICVGYTGQ